ncbi:hypothetical protein [Pseudarthrobacter sp. CCNWLW207]|uniref:hypothetical protein n=1 Tax=Pseudarthrobacter sp. CCNWLW207 TaxID=3127468 RepID=UPI003077EFE9
MTTITEQQMMQLVLTLNGTYTNVDGAFGNQCWDSTARIAQLLNLPVINTGGDGRWPGWAGNMVDAFPQSPEIAAAYELLPPEATVMPGDTLVWGDSNQVWYPKTHVANAVKQETGNGWLLCLSQNSSAARPDLPGYDLDSTGPIILQHLPKKGLIGIIRPRGGTITLASAIITALEEAGMALEHDDKVFVQLVVNGMGDRVILDNRAQIKAATDIQLNALAAATYELKKWDHETDNSTGDRVINDFRARLDAGFETIRGELVDLEGAALPEAADFIGKELPQ